MKLLRTIYALGALLCIQSALSAGTEEEFIAKYAVDPEIAEILDKNVIAIEDHLNRIKRNHITEHETWTFPWLPGYIVKFNLARIYGMERMRRCIEKNNLDLLGLPDKRIYHVKGRPTKLSNFNYVVVVKLVEKDPNAQPMTTRHVEQLIRLMKDTGYVSTTSANYIRTYNGKLIIIDTESTYDLSLLVSKGFMRLISPRHNIAKDYTQEALEFLIIQMVAEMRKNKKRARKSLQKEIEGHLRKGPRSLNYPAFFRKQLENKGAL